MTAALDFLHPAPAVPAPSEAGGSLPGSLAPDLPRPALRVVGGAEAPASRIPVQPGPVVTVSLTHGCDLPLEALRETPERGVTCHPCDQAVVQLLLQQARRSDDAALVCSADVLPGTLRLG